jgi:hypothetical protein
MKETLRPPKETRESAEIGSKKTVEKIIELHKKNKKVHDIATSLGLKELQVIRIINDYKKRMSDKGRLSMISAFGRNSEQEQKSFSAFKSALSNLGKNTEGV